MNLENLTRLICKLNIDLTVVDRAQVSRALRSIDKGEDKRAFVNRVAAKYGLGPVFTEGDFVPMSGEVWADLIHMLEVEDW